jgi:hypothetical protein
MKFVYEGKYIQVRGRMFAFGHPVEVNDKATILELSSRPDFRRIEDGKKENQAPAEVLSDKCPKCGKVVKRGKYMHQKWCNG